MKKIFLLCLVCLFGFDLYADQNIEIEKTVDIKNPPWFFSISRDEKNIIKNSCEKIFLLSINFRLLRTININTKDDCSGVFILSDNGKFAVSSYKKKVYIWDAVKFKKIRIIECNKYIGKISFSSNGQFIAGELGDKEIAVWDFNGNLLRILKGHTKEIMTILFNPDSNKIISASRDGEIRIWGIDGSHIDTLKGHKEAVTSMSISPDGELLVSASVDRTIRLWNIAKGKLLSTIKIDYERWYPTKRIIPLRIDNIKFSPDGTKIIGVGENTVVIWDRSGKLLWKHTIDYLSSQIHFLGQGKYLLLFWYGTQLIHKNYGNFAKVYYVRIK